MAPHDPSYFEQQRDILIQEIGQSLEQVLQNVNKLNRSIEGVNAVGSEFQSVEALWSNFEALMGKKPEADAQQPQGQDQQQQASSGR